MVHPLPISRRAAVAPFQAMAITDQVAQLRAQGRDIISLAVGEPRGGAPEAVAARADFSTERSDNLGYTSSLGLGPLRVAVAEHYRRWYGIDVPPGQVAITTGSSGAFLLVFLAAFNPGDRVALVSPGYPAYRNVLTALGCEVVEIAAGPETRFQPTPRLLEQAVAQGGPVQGLILASPANPTGTMVGQEDLTALVAWCAEHGVRLISDEIYHGMVFTQDAGRGTCLWQCEATPGGEDGRSGVVISSFSKYWGMTGWRLGWALCPPELIDAVDALAGNVALAPPTPAQLAALEAFSPESYAEADARVADIATTRAALLERVPQLRWGHVAPADGAFYLYAHLGEQLTGFENSADYCSTLLQEAGIALTPGLDFDPAGGGEYVRMSFGGGLEAVTEAVDRIIAWQDARG